MKGNTHTTHTKKARISEARELCRTRLKGKRSQSLLPIFIVVSWTIRATVAQVTAIPLTDNNIQQIVDAHNLFRGMVDPPASNMQRIVRHQYRQLANYTVLIMNTSYMCIWQLCRAHMQSL